MLYVCHAWALGDVTAVESTLDVHAICLSPVARDRGSLQDCLAHKNVWVGVGAESAKRRWLSAIGAAQIRQIEVLQAPYRATSPKRKRPNPRDHPRTLGIGLR